MNLHLDLMHYWHAGTGVGRGGHLDAVVRRDALGLPYVPGRTLKGLLRDAVRTAHAFGWYGDADDPEVLLFGSDSRTPSTDGSTPGLLRVSDAHLPSPLKDAMKMMAPDQRVTIVAGLYREMFSTAVDMDSGTARPKSLRGIEVAVPCQLVADIEWLDDASEVRSMQTLRVALPLLRAVGSHRNRGYGRMRVELEGAE